MALTPTLSPQERGEGVYHRYSLLPARHSLLLHHLGRGLDRRLRLLQHRLGVVDGVVGFVDQAGDAPGVAPEIPFEIAGRGTDIDARSLALGRDADRDLLAESPHRRPRHRFHAAHPPP